MSSKKNIVILGAGESGTGTAMLAHHLGYKVFVSDFGTIKPTYKALLDAEGIAFEEGSHDLKRIRKANIIVKSPGIPEKSEVLKTAKLEKITVIGEMEFAGKFLPKNAKVIGITGSNGKTTTTLLTAHLLQAAGMEVYTGGNVGISFARLVLDYLKTPKNEASAPIFVLELSSFQLDDIQEFRVNIGILLNITPDHLDRYEYKMENYVRSKYRIGLNQKRGDTLLLNGEDTESMQYLQANGSPSKGKVVLLKKGYYAKQTLKIGRTHLFSTLKTALKGPHNMFNAICALRVGILLGAAPEKLQHGLDTFVTPPHRLEKVATIAGVTYVNDSKATNVDSVFYALQAMETKIVWIVGGTDKGNDYTPLVPWVKKKVRAIVCLGADNTKLLQFFGPMQLPMVEAKSAQEAVTKATKLAKKGYTVLLSPACASFDLFNNYEHRGQLFREAVNQLTMDN